ncbi:hypothetical protein PV10_00950 [Exophiala mesophila]|uniref:Uncharacterized protein n=1 Tax=Exophiala mesophila TaxID=212818 RepID=A0A0D2AE47_EXOME|nr:uncharacterized protein PV10_00950 [Exophiala mesophila]KIV97168.1 hypothetical protein PV10_00950 [Exophiala mesophila]
MAYRPSGNKGTAKSDTHGANQINNQSDSAPPNLSDEDLFADSTNADSFFEDATTGLDATTGGGMYLSGDEDERFDMAFREAIFGPLPASSHSVNHFGNTAEPLSPGALDTAPQFQSQSGDCLVDFQRPLPDLQPSLQPSLPIICGYNQSEPSSSNSAEQFHAQSFEPIQSLSDFLQQRTATASRTPLNSFAVGDFEIQPSQPISPHVTRDIPNGLEENHPRADNPFPSIEGPDLPSAPISDQNQIWLAEPNDFGLTEEMGNFLNSYNSGVPGGDPAAQTQDLATSPQLAESENSNNLSSPLRQPKTPPSSDRQLATLASPGRPTQPRAPITVPMLPTREQSLATVARYRAQGTPASQAQEMAEEQLGRRHPMEQLAQQGYGGQQQNLGQAYPQPQTPQEQLRGQQRPLNRSPFPPQAVRYEPRALFDQRYHGQQPLEQQHRPHQPARGPQHYGPNLQRQQQQAQVVPGPLMPPQLQQHRQFLHQGMMPYHPDDPLAGPPFAPTTRILQRYQDASRNMPQFVRIGVHGIDANGNRYDLPFNHPMPVSFGGMVPQSMANPIASRPQGQWGNANTSSVPSTPTNQGSTRTSHGTRRRRNDDPSQRSAKKPKSEWS